MTDEPAQMTDALDGLLPAHLPTRRLVAETCRTAGGEFSARDIAKTLGMELGRVSYHFRTLERLGAIGHVRDEPVRGSVRHVFEWTGPAAGGEAERLRRENADLRAEVARLKAAPG